MAHKTRRPTWLTEAPEVRTWHSTSYGGSLRIVDNAIKDESAKVREENQDIEVLPRKLVARM